MVMCIIHMEDDLLRNNSKGLKILFMKTKVIFIALMLLASKGISQWIQTNGPPGAGISPSAVLISGDNILAGSIGDGMYLSSDHGLSWKGIEPFISGVNDFAVCGDYIFMAPSMDGVMRSADHGITWIRNEGLEIYANEFAVNGNKIYAGALQVYWSTDFGESWTTFDTTSDFQSGISAMAVDGNILYAAHHDTGIYASSDDGATWTYVGKGIEGRYINSMTISDTSIFCGTYEDGIFRSTDNGTSWIQVNNGLTNMDVTSFIVSGSTIFAGTLNRGIFRSDNNGDLWTPANNGMDDYIGILSMWSDSADFVLGSIYGYIYASDNSGVSWRRLYGLPVTWISSLAVKDETVFAGTFNDGLFKTTNNGGAWEECENGIPFWLNIITLAIAGKDIYVGTGDGIYVSENNGESWVALHNGLPNDLDVNSIIITGNNIFAGTNDFGVYLSTDQGASWAPVNNGLAFKSVSSLAYLNGKLFAGTQGGVYTSSNNGGLWTSFNTGLTDPCVTSLVVRGSGIMAGTICEGGGLFYSDVESDSWVQIISGVQISCITESNAGLFATTYSARLFMSTDDGISWEEVSDGLPSLNIYSVLVNGNNIYVGTNGGGVYINSTLLTGVKEAVTNTDPVRIYPNPANSTITIYVDDISQDGRFTIFSVSGQKMLDFPFNNTHTSFDISKFPSGAYFLRYENGHRTAIKKLIVD